MNEAKVKGSFCFPKKERLHHRSLVEGLFRNGKTFYEFPFRATWRLISPEELQRNFRDRVPQDIAKLQMMVTVPKKKRRRAVDRVLMRRRIREAFRLNKASLNALLESVPEAATLSLALVYIHDKNLNYAFVNEKMKATIAKVQNLIAPQPEK